MWEFSPRTAVLAMPKPKPIVLAQVVRRKFLLQTGTSFWHSAEFGFGRKY